jgi:hypothetical protein
MSNLPEMPTMPSELPTIDPVLAEQLIAEAHANKPEPAVAVNQDAADALKALTSKEEAERVVLPEDPLERAMGDEPPSVRKAVIDSAWLHGYPDIDVRQTNPSEDDKVRFALSLTLDDTPFSDVQHMLGGRLPVVVESITGDQQEMLFQFLSSSNLSKDDNRYFSELQYAGAAFQVREVGTRKFSNPQNITELQERIKEFKKMQNQRWALVLLAVRQSLVKSRLLAEMIVNYDEVFTVPGASGSQ